MKLRVSELWVFALCVFVFASPSLTAPTSNILPTGFIVQLHSDEPSRLFFSDTKPQSAAEQPAANARFSAGIWNDGNSRLLSLHWRVETLAGKTVLQKTTQALSPRGPVTIRQSLSISHFGTYRLKLTARPLHAPPNSWRRDDSLSFAIVATPLPGGRHPQRNAANLPVATSAQPSDEERRFLARIGASVVPPIVPVGQATHRDARTLPLFTDAPETSAATLRTLLSLRGATPPDAFRIRVAPGPEAEAGASAQLQAQLLVARVVTALTAGARNVSATFASPMPVSEAELARAAVWSNLTRRLAGGRFETDLFPEAPLLRATSFIVPGGRTAVVWAERNDNLHARLVVALPGARVSDIWGNEIAREQNGHVTIPLGASPVYVWSKVKRKTWQRAWRGALLDGPRPLAAQALAFTQPPGGLRRNGVLRLRVRMQNLSLSGFRGSLQLTPPPGWSLLESSTPIVLLPGESRVVSFPVAISQRRILGLYPVVIKATRGNSVWSWNQVVRVATAGEAVSGMKIDGELSDWRGMFWMATKTKPESNLVKLAVRWDARNLYVATMIYEPKLQPRRETGRKYEFWNGYDAIQLAFGLSDTKQVKPRRAPFHDTDYGFLLSPFGVKNERIEGRVLRLWNTKTPFATGATRDRVRWGGAVPGSRCSITRNDSQHLTIYEASMPLREMPTLRPAWRAKNDIPVRFSWRVHDDEGGSASWSRANSVFPWWGGNGSFWPPDQTLLAAQTPLGFTEGTRPTAMPELLPRPALPASAAPPRPPIAVPAPTATPTPRPRRFSPPEVAPMSPSSLPSAAPPPVVSPPVAPRASAPLPKGTPLPPVMPDATR